MLVYALILLRIFSNSLANLYQKKATQFAPAMVVNLYSYLIMSLICIIPALHVDWLQFSYDFWLYVFVAGTLCTIGTILLIEALKLGELSELAPINSYKSIIGMLSAFVLLHEIPSMIEFVAIILIVMGSYFVLDNDSVKFSLKTFVRKDIRLRFFALFCTGIEASLLKKIIMMSNFKISLILWSFSGLICSMLCCLLFKNNNYKIDKKGFFNIVYIAIMLLVMQLSTNYVFSKMDVGIALALFQLSSLVAVYFGYKVFKEKNILKKLVGTIIMILGSSLIILS